MQKTQKKESVIRLSAAHKHMSRSPSRTGESEREREGCFQKLWLEIMENAQTERHLMER